MGTREQLQSELETLLGARHVYYQPPASVKMEYPAIKYSKTKIKSTRANGAIYYSNTCYEIIVIDNKPDNPVINKILALPYCSYDRCYKADNLYHDVFTLYY